MSMRESDLIQPASRLREAETVRKVEPERDKPDQREQEQSQEASPQDTYEGGAVRAEEEEVVNTESSAPDAPPEGAGDDTEGIDLLA